MKILIHKYKLIGLNIVMDIYSGAVHVVDDSFYDILDFFSEPFEAGESCPQNIKEALSGKYTDEELEEGGGCR